ncbi:hypothetical protein J4E81_005588 [Alternaria sp. BMP 2799]|nr:hypothetical protein J4E81_005588 [Alternaria sp. BMP 2799]
MGAPPMGGYYATPLHRTRQQAIASFGEDAMEASAADVIGCFSSTVDSGLRPFDRRSLSNIIKMPKVHTPSRLEAKEESPPFNKPREATPDLTTFTNIQKRERRMTQWDIKPAGYENITAGGRLMG